MSTKKITKPLLTRITRKIQKILGKKDDKTDVKLKSVYNDYDTEDETDIESQSDETDIDEDKSYESDIDEGDAVKKDAKEIGEHLAHLFKYIKLDKNQQLSDDWLDYLFWYDEPSKSRKGIFLEEIPDYIYFGNMKVVINNDIIKKHGKYFYILFELTEKELQNLTDNWIINSLLNSLGGINKKEIERVAEIIKSLEKDERFSDFLNSKIPQDKDNNDNPNCTFINYINENCEKKGGNKKIKTKSRKTKSKKIKNKSRKHKIRRK